MREKATTMLGTMVTRSTTFETPPARATMLRLIRGGLSATEAANIAALSIGLRPVASGWSTREIERLRFLRYLAGSGRLVP
ncbi:MAG: hypothetical protein L0221_14485 [Chloroflexi bacterium]|nr:hypothetical protein [Chloroflexota bacterium]